MQTTDEARLAAEVKLNVHHALECARSAKIKFLGANGGKGKICFPSASHEQDKQPYPPDLYRSYLKQACWPVQLSTSHSPLAHAIETYVIQ